MHKRLLSIVFASTLLFSCSSHNLEPISSSLSSSETDSYESIDYKVEYATLNGTFEYRANSITSSEADSLCLVPHETMRKGTLSVDMTATEPSDNGIVLLAKHASQSMWEGSGVSYYFYFISQAGTLYLGKTRNSEWTCVNESNIRGYSLKKNYNLKISFDVQESFVQFHCYLNDEHYYSVRDYETNFGNEFGLRAGKADTTFSYINASLKFLEPSRQQAGDYYVADGGFLSKNGAVTSTANNSISYKEDSFQLGTISVDMVQSGSASDSGLVFGLERNGNIRFWENNVSYYFFFINVEGHAYLGKVNNGSWSSLYYDYDPVPDFSIEKGHTNNLKVIRDNELISCYIDDVKVVDYVDYSPLLGKEYGFRSGSSIGLSFKNMEVQKTGEIVIAEPKDYDVIKGKFGTANDVAMFSTVANSIALNKRLSMTNGTLSFKMTQGSVNDAGVIFRSDDDVTEYYLFCVKNARTHLYKVVDGEINELTPDEYLTAGYNSNTVYDAKIVVNNYSIYCYFNGILYATYTDEDMLSGSRFGFYSSAAYASFMDVELSYAPSIETHNTLIIGHSYMELWSNYAEDLADLDDVYDIGIGGSVTSDWIDMMENVIPYAPKTLIYMIGINDYPRGYTPSQIAINVRQLLVALKSRIPTLEKIALVSVNRCVTHEVYKEQIAATNILYHQICDDLNYVHYADVDDAFLNNGVPDASCFVDGLHPSAASYLVIADAIRNALSE